MPPAMAFTPQGSPQSDDRYYPQTDNPKRKSAAGRELVRWDPDKDQLVLLCLDYISGMLGVAIPWDQVAELFGSLLGKTQIITGEALKQHLSKLYKYRVDFNLVVPPKLDRTHRRKMVVGLSSVNSTLTPAPTRPRAKKAAVNNEVKAQTPSRPAGIGLLHLLPGKGSKPEAQPVTPKTPANASGGGRRKRNGDNLASSIEIKEEEESDSDFAEAPQVKKRGAAAHGNKRGRKAKGNTFVDDDVDTRVYTPSKKPKNDSHVRPQPAQNYSEQPQSDAEADASHSSFSRKYSHTSQDGGIYNQSLPFRQADMNPAYQNYSHVPTLYAYNHSGDATPFTPSPTNYSHGNMNVSRFRFAEQPAPAMQSYNGNEYGTPAAIPRADNDMFTSGNNSSGTNMKQISPTQLADSLQAINDSRTNGSGNQQKNGVVAKVENDTQVSNHSFDMHGNGSFSNIDGTTSPHFCNPGETGLTPDMAQTGFGIDPAATNHTASFDRGLGGFDDGHEMDYQPARHGSEFLFGDEDLVTANDYPS
ncbi:hypothetical protein LTR49_026568 [Elasticomyces elasticus]|nr:hypothetical protein LTR49_026568 [Elasticomyces elasticus]